MNLDIRLSAVAALINPGKRLLDIGTDHAYLPVYCVKNNISISAICSDINKGPLQNAIGTVSDAELSDKITCVLSNGFENIEPDGADEIVIAGMGGILIAEILSSVSWIKNENVHLVLQPMTHAENTRKFLLSNGFRIEKEIACSDARHTYVVISARYTGETARFEDGYAYYGELKNNKSADAEKYLKRVYSSLKKKCDALIKSNQNDSEVARLLSLLSDFKSNTEIDYDNC